MGTRGPPSTASASPDSSQVGSAKKSSIVGARRGGSGRPKSSLHSTLPAPPSPSPRVLRLGAAFDAHLVLAKGRDGLPRGRCGGGRRRSPSSPAARRRPGGHRAVGGYRSAEGSLRTSNRRSFMRTPRPPPRRGSSWAWQRRRSWNAAARRAQCWRASPGGHSLRQRGSCGHMARLHVDDGAARAEVALVTEQDHFPVGLPSIRIREQDQGGMVAGPLDRLPGGAGAGRRCSGSAAAGSWSARG